MLAGPTRCGFSRFFLKAVSSAFLNTHPRAVLQHLEDSFENNLVKNTPQRSKVILQTLQCPLNNNNSRKSEH